VAGRITATLRRRAVPIVVATVIVVVGIAFEFLWYPVFFHQDRWFTQGDVWGMLRAAHFVGWGDIGGVYTRGNGVVALPGMPILLAPVAALAGSLHLTESYIPVFLARPTAAILLVPAELVIASTVVFASDSLAEELGIGRTRRVWLCVVVGILAWPTAALLGHAEDALAMTLALYALRAMLQERWVRMGWLLGFAVLVQPLVALTVPLLVAVSPQGQRARTVVRSSVVSVFVVGLCLLSDPSDTYHSLVLQPTPPALNHATPWVHLAPTVSQGLRSIRQVQAPTFGHGAFSRIALTAHAGADVSGGPGRIIDLLLALLVAGWVWRRPQSSDRVLWLTAAVLVSRCFFEAVMTPYYLAPPLILLLVLAARADRMRFATAVATSFAISVYAYAHLGPWVWWLPIVAGLSLILWLTFPVEGVSPPGGGTTAAPGTSVPGESDGDARLTTTVHLA